MSPVRDLGEHTRYADLYHVLCRRRTGPPMKDRRRCPAAAKEEDGVSCLKILWALLKYGKTRSVAAFYRNVCCGGPCRELDPILWLTILRTPRDDTKVVVPSENRGNGGKRTVVHFGAWAHRVYQIAKVLIILGCPLSTSLAAADRETMIVNVALSEAPVNFVEAFAKMMAAAGGLGPVVFYRVLKRVAAAAPPPPLPWESFRGAASSSKSSRFWRDKHDPLWYKLCADLDPPVGVFQSSGYSGAVCSPFRPPILF